MGSNGLPDWATRVGDGRMPVRRQPEEPRTDRAHWVWVGVSGVGCLIVVVLLVMAGLNAHELKVQLRQEGLIVPSRVVSIEDAGKTLRVEVEFVTVVGEPIRAEAWSGKWARVKVGDEVHVRYNPHDPSWYPEDIRFPEDSNWPVSAGMPFVGAFALCAAWVAYVALLWSRSPQAAARAARRRRKNIRPQTKDQRLYGRRRPRRR